MSLNLPKVLNDAYALWESKILFKQLGNIKNKKIVDIACGGGRISVLLAKKGAKVSGVDITMEMLEYAEKLARKKNCLKNLELINANAWDTKLPSKHFDKTLLLGILEHLPDHQKKLTIKEAVRLTKKNGSILIVINNKQSILLNMNKKWKKPQQNKSGYYSSLMKPDEIIKYMNSLNLKIKIVNSNLNYSLLFHLINRIDYKLIDKNLEKLFLELFDYLIELDYQNLGKKVTPKIFPNMESLFADQFFIIAKK